MKSEICLQICSNRNLLFVRLWDGLRQKGFAVQSFHFSHKELGLPPQGSPFDKSYIKTALPFKNWERLSFFLKEERSYRALRKSIDPREIAFCHAHTIFTDGNLALRLKKEEGIPYIVAFRSTDALFFRLRFYLRKLGKEIISQADRVVFLSPVVKENFKNRYLSYEEGQALDKKSVIIPNGINPFFLENQPKSAHKAPEDKTLSVITMGSVEKKKNQLLVCRALNQLVEEGWSIDYRLYGRVLDETYSKRIASYPFAKVMGPKDQKDLLDLYRQADLFILASKRETFGLVYGEAISQGLPVLYTEGQGFDGQFPEGDVGFHIDSADPDDLVQKIKLALVDYEARSARAMKQVQAFDWNRVVDLYSELYQEMLL